MDLRRSQGLPESYGHEVILRCAMGGACSTGDLSRWWIATLIELILLISLICADAAVCTASMPV